MYFGQALQDKYVLNVLNNKQNGYFLEIGSNHPININNTYILEHNFNWKGIMVEYDSNYLSLYKSNRPNSIHVINDARNVDYKELLTSHQFPNNIDYLQIDLEADNGSTIQTLELLDKQIFDTYKFATITFEHDIYNTNIYNTREISRNIFKRRGYLPVFADINNQGINPYEDWYVHPDLVDINYINQLIEINKNKYKKNNLTDTTINFEDIVYPNH